MTTPREWPTSSPEAALQHLRSRWPGEMEVEFILTKAAQTTVLYGTESLAPRMQTWIRVLRRRTKAVVDWLDERPRFSFAPSADSPTGELPPGPANIIGFEPGRAIADIEATVEVLARRAKELNDWRRDQSKTRAVSRTKPREWRRALATQMLAITGLLSPEVTATDLAVIQDVARLELPATDWASFDRRVNLWSIDLERLREDIAAGKVFWTREKFLDFCVHALSTAETRATWLELNGGQVPPRLLQITEAQLVRTKSVPG
jgi:hypothetical protein